jgi:hypothetical protein
VCDSKHIVYRCGNTWWAVRSWQSKDGGRSGLRSRAKVCDFVVSEPHHHRRIMYIMFIMWRVGWLMHCCDRSRWAPFVKLWWYRTLVVRMSTYGDWAASHFSPPLELPFSPNLLPGIPSIPILHPHLEMSWMFPVVASLLPYRLRKDRQSSSKSSSHLCISRRTDCSWLLVHLVTGSIRRNCVW